jgi:hypothetical protein
MAFISGVNWKQSASKSPTCSRVLLLLYLALMLLVVVLAMGGIAGGRVLFFPTWQFYWTLLPCCLGVFVASRRCYFRDSGNGQSRRWAHVHSRSLGGAALFAFCASWISFGTSEYLRGPSELLFGRVDAVSRMHNVRRACEIQVVVEFRETFGRRRICLIDSSRDSIGPSDLRVGDLVAVTVRMTAHFPVVTKIVRTAPET